MRQAVVQCIQCKPRERQVATALPQKHWDAKEVRTFLGLFFLIFKAPLCRGVVAATGPTARVRCGFSVGRHVNMVSISTGVLELARDKSNHTEHLSRLRCGGVSVDSQCGVAEFAVACIRCSDHASSVWRVDKGANSYPQDIKPLYFPELATGQTKREDQPYMPVYQSVKGSRND